MASKGGRVGEGTFCPRFNAFFWAKPDIDESFLWTDLDASMERDPWQDVEKNRQKSKMVISNFHDLKCLAGIILAIVRVSGTPQAVI